MQDLEDRERDLAGRTSGMAGADLAMPQLIIASLTVTKKNYHR